MNTHAPKMDDDMELFLRDKDGSGFLFHLTKKTMILIVITFLKRAPQGGSILM